MAERSDLRLVESQILNGMEKAEHPPISLTFTYHAVGLDHKEGRPQAAFTVGFQLSM